MSEWASKDFARVFWAGAPVNDDLLDSLLDSAQESCETYAPELDEWCDVPERYKQAVVMQARENFEAAQRDGDVLGFGDSGFAVRLRPLSTSVKSLLRPRRAVPGVG